MDARIETRKVPVYPGDATPWFALRRDRATGLVVNRTADYATEEEALAEAGTWPDAP